MQDVLSVTTNTSETANTMITTLNIVIGAAPFLTVVVALLSKQKIVIYCWYKTCMNYHCYCI
jgi:hypothetical protein